MKSSAQPRLKLTVVLLVTILVQLPMVRVSAGFPPDSHGANRSVAKDSFKAGAVPDVQADLIRKIPLQTNDVIYSPVTHMLYASVPSTGGPGGNSITTIDPLTTAVVSSVFVGSEPDRLALSDDGHSLYTSLAGAFSIRRFDVVSQTPGLEFAVGFDSFFGRYNVSDLVVAPGNPNLVAVARSYGGVSPPEAGVAIFNNGVQLPGTGPSQDGGSDFLAFSADPTKLYGTGLYSGLQTLTISSSGISMIKTTSFASDSRIKFDNGLVYANNGQVVNPDNNGSLMGTFPSVTNSAAFVPDSSVGRAYFLTQDGGAVTLRAFDMNTFLPVGTLVINGASGTPNSLVRWGSNGLAFRTSGGQLFILQTGLIPSADPIPSPSPTPTPSPTPSPTPVATFVRQLALPTNDLIYSPLTDSLYASVPSSGGVIGNSITTINPLAGSVGNSVFVGSEPGQLALADDGHSLYVGLNGSGAVRRFDVSSQMPVGSEFSLGNGFNGPATAQDISVMPGNSGSVAVSHSGGTFVFDDGVRRSQGIGSFAPIAFGSPSLLYFGNVQEYNVVPSGLFIERIVPTDSSGDIVFSNGLVYMAGGAVVDAHAGIIRGKFSVGYNNLMVVDAAKSRLYFLSSSGSNCTIRSFDINTFLPLASVAILGVNDMPTSLVRWGSNGLAFRTTNGRVFLIQTALVDAAIPVASPTPTPSPTPSPSPAYIPTYVNRLPLPANDLVFNPSNQSIYASVPSTAVSIGNTITKLDPQTGTIGPSVFIGSEPNKLALGDDGQTIYASLDGAIAIRRFDIGTQTAELQFSTGSAQPVADMDVMPGSPQTLGLPLFNSGIGLFDNGVKRPNTGQIPASQISQIEFNGPSTIYGFDGYAGLHKFAVDSSGVTAVGYNGNLLSVSTSSMKFSNGLLYTATGRVLDPEALKAVGTFSLVNFQGSFVVDPGLGKIFYIYNQNSSVVLAAFELATFRPLGSVTLLPNVIDTPGGLVRWGSNGVAFRVARGSGPLGAGNPREVYLAQSSLISSSGSIPTGVQVGNPAVNTFESSGTLQLSVTRNGDVSGSSTVNYATVDGTATAGTDYTAVSGTLMFGPGEFSKNVQIAITDDNLYEGSSETFSLTLSNPSAGTLLGGSFSTAITIIDNDFKPFVSVNSMQSVIEGNSGITNAVVPVTLSNASFQTITVSYATSNGSASAGSDFTNVSGTLTFPPGTVSQSINIPILGDLDDEGDETLNLSLSNPTNASGLSPSQCVITIRNDDGFPQVQFTAATYQVSEGAGSAVLTVTRFGKLTDTVSADFASVDAGSATQTRDYTIAAGTLQFAPGETSKTLRILITDDAYIESTEFLNVVLSNPAGAGVGTPATARLSILDNDVLLPPFNPIDDAKMFTRQHYYDFLSRLPDQAGLDYWSGQITQCGSDPACVRIKRVDVSNAFFYEQEYQQTGAYVYRLYRAAFGNNQPFPNPNPNPQFPNEEKKLPSYAAFASDRARVRGGSSLAQTQLDLANAFVQRPTFLTKYPANLDGSGFVDAVLATVRNEVGADLTSQRQSLIDLFNQSGPGAVMYRLADDDLQTNPINNRAFIDAEYNRAFVATQYFGYLRRNPDIPGFIFWLGQVNSAALRDVAKQHAMVCSFITSTEYQQRFSSTATRSNQECQ